MKKQKGNFEVMFGLFIVLIFIVMGGIAIAINYVSCSARWADTFKTDFGIFQGCRIEVAPGKWIPEDRYREVEQ